MGLGRCLLFFDLSCRVGFDGNDGVVNTFMTLLPSFIVENVYQQNYLDPCQKHVIVWILDWPVSVRLLILQEENCLRQAAQALASIFPLEWPQSPFLVITLPLCGVCVFPYHWPLSPRRA